VGCFYTDALRKQMNVDICFQKPEGICSSLKEGDITQRKIYEISPTNNGTIIYKMSVLEIKTFLGESGAEFYDSSIEIEQDDQESKVKDLLEQTLTDNQMLTIVLNDSIHEVCNNDFSELSQIQSITDAETLIS
jgi:2',3'-cyclic-nucleotide 2'-phosphodiesterase (5'-nucleotidase family)